ncbi:hypothetical protein HK096_006806, partial [Nowakowskiella sp. JEL0078]
MKFSILCVLGISILLNPVHAIIGGFVKTSGQNFVLDGCKRVFSGTNKTIFCSNVIGSQKKTTWLSLSWNKIAPGWITLLLYAVTAHNLDVIRTWAFCESCSTPYITFSGTTMTVDSIALESLDYVLAGASQRNIRLVLTLTNNWSDYGGMDVYTKALGGTYHDDFYTSTTIKAAFKVLLFPQINHETGIAYKDDPTIFAWELINEPRCSGSSTTFPASSSCNADVIVAWTDEMSKYIKTLDSNHLVTTGEEGFGLPVVGTSPSNTYVYRTDAGTNFTATMSLSAIDYGNFHLYPIPWGLTNQP